MKLSGQQMEEFCKALCEAFTVDTLAQMVRFKLETRLERFTSSGTHGHLETIVFELVSAAERMGLVDRLIAGAYQVAPANAVLSAFAQQFGLTSLPGTLQEFERIIRDSNSLFDPSLFRQQLGAQEPRVCRIEFTAGGQSWFGTGFLVNSDIVMTNYHVVAPLRTSSGVGVARFDYYNFYHDGKLIRTNEGRTVDFAADWLLDFSPPETDGTGAEALDYALVKLKESPGNDNLIGVPSPDSQKRGCIKIPSVRQEFALKSSIFILQHPSAKPIKLAMDTQSVLGLYDGDTRVRYTTNTEPGSSGSPCFTPGWELTALHHSGDPNFDPPHKPTYNEGIPIHAIRNLIEKHGHAWILEKNGKC
jgi:hypothetical protein